MTFVPWLAKTGMRIGLVAGAVKVSIDNNVWSLETNLGSETYDKLKKIVLPGTIVYKDRLPTAEEVHTNVGSKWNQNVNCAFSTLHSLPSIIREKIDSFETSKS